MYRTRAVLVAVALAAFLGPTAWSQQKKSRGERLRLGGDRFFSAGQYVKAVEYYSAALRADPKLIRATMRRCTSYLKLQRWRAAYADMTQVLKRMQAMGQPKFVAMWYGLRCSLAVRLGEYPLALSDGKAGLAKWAESPSVNQFLGLTLAIHGRFAEAEKKLRFARLNVRTQWITNPEEIYVGLALVRLEAGNRAGALQIARLMRTELPKWAAASWALEVAILASGTRDTKRLVELETLLAAHAKGAGMFIHLARGVLYDRLGRYEKAFGALRATGGGAVYLTWRRLRGELALRLGKLDWAVRDLGPLVQVNPAIKARLEQLPSGTLVLARIARRNRERSSLKMTTRGDLEDDEEFARQLEQELLVAIRRHRYALANRQCDQLIALRGAQLKQRALQWRARIKRYRKLFDRLLVAINNGRFRDKPIQLAGSLRATLERADDNGIWLALERGRTRWSWGQLPFARYQALCAQLSLGGQDWITLAELSYDNQAERQGLRAYIRAWRDAGLRAEVSRRYAARAKVSEPAGGFVVFKRRLVSAADHKFLAIGLVHFRGRWIKPAVRRHLERGHQQIGGKWVSLTAPQLTALGYKRVKGDWVSPEKLAKQRGEWTSAAKLVTAHYVLRTNMNDDFLQKLGTLIEVAYGRFEKLFGPLPKGSPRMTLLAFAKFKDYQAYCQKVGKLNSLAAAGFAPSEAHTACGWDKLSDAQALLRTMVHEAVHLYFWERNKANLPSWLGEGMATYFEGFKRRGKSWEFHHLPRSRLALLKRALRKDTFIPLKEFFGANAGQLINNDSAKALVFYSQAWGLFYFFQQTARTSYRQKFAKLLEKVARGATVKLDAELGVELDRLEKIVKRFLEDL